MQTQKPGVEHPEMEKEFWGHQREPLQLCSLHVLKATYRTRNRNFRQVHDSDGRHCNCRRWLSLEPLLRWAGRSLQLAAAGCVHTWSCFYTMAGDSPSQLLYNLVCLPSSPPAALVRVGAGPLWGASDPRHLTSLFLIQPVSKGTLFFFFLLLALSLSLFFFF